jgi:ABC-type multidrug transport system fused ATPase/permease subunit
VLTLYSDIYSLLTPVNRRSALVLLGLIIVGTLFEILGIGLLLPVISLLMDEQIATRYPSLQALIEMVGNPDRETLIKYVLFLLIAVYLVKNLYIAFLAWWQARFTIGLRIEFAQRLFTLYLKQPYYFHVQRNSAQLIRNVTGEVDQFIGNAVNPLLSLVAEITVLISILVLLLAIEPMGSMIVFAVLLSAAWAFYRSMRARITHWGQIRSYHDGQRMQHLQQGLGAVKDVKILGRETNFISAFYEHNNMSGRMAQFMEILQKLPRLWLEMLAVVGFVLLILIMLGQERDMSDIVPVMGLFAAAAFRLMPSVSRILVAMQALRYGIYAVQNLQQDLEFQILVDTQATDEKVQRISIEKEINLTGINYKYPEAASVTLSDIDISIRKGTSVGFIGPSGSGKSTLVDLILGLLTPTSGVVRVDGTDIQENLRGWQDQIGYVPQTIYLTDDTLRNNIAFGLPEDQIDADAVERAVRAAQLEEFVESQPHKMETIVGERGVRLSGGQRQRIGIARALYHDPEVLVLDEATSALDTVTEAEVMKTVLELHGSKTVIIVAHRLSTVEYCDYLYRLEQGRIVAHGMPEKLLRVSVK